MRKEDIMKYINKCILNPGSFKEETLLSMLSSKSFNEDKEHIINIICENEDLSVINKRIFNYFEKKKDLKKQEKSMKKFERNKEESSIIEEDYYKYENYIYSLISLKNYNSKMSKTEKKVKLLNIENLFGHDPIETRKDVFQEGKLYLWEGLKKYGTLPSKEKNFGGRVDKGHKRSIASKSTFSHKNLFNHLMNLGKKASGEKFTHVPVEFTPETIGEKDTED